MGIASDSGLDWNAALAALARQVDLGVGEVVQEALQNSFDLPEAVPWARRSAEPAAPMAARPAAPLVPPSGTDAVAVARASAEACGTIDDLRAALTAFDLCELKRGARKTVFAAGNPAARVLILGDAPTREEDLEGRPFIGPQGQLLDAMFAAIGLSRSSDERPSSLYILPAIPWRTPGDREPDAAELALLRPFTERHIALSEADFIVTMGNAALLAATGQGGVHGARGKWGQAFGKPLLPMMHPSYLLQSPGAKREAWADLLSLKARLK